VPNGDFVTAAMGEGLLTVAAGENVVRLLPPLIVTEKEINEAVSKMSAACRKIEAAMSATTRGAAE
jgi:acetylornithine/N-succinyldiaminopimelate aminotransferase